MDFPIEYQGLRDKNLAVRLGLWSFPRLVEKGIPLKPQKGKYSVQDSAGNDIDIQFKKKMVDPLPQVKIGDELLSLAPPFSWVERFIIFFPLVMLMYLTGLIGALLSLLVLGLIPRIVRMGQSQIVTYGTSVLLSLSILGVAYSYEWTQSPQFLLDKESNEDIQEYIAGLEVPFHQNNIPYAIKISQIDGKQALSEGNYKQAYEIYQKVLAISYKQGSVQGTAVSLGALTSVYESMDDLSAAIKAGMLMYKLGLAMGDPREYGVAEALLGRLLQQKDRNLGMMWRMKAKKSLKNTPYQHDYIRLIVDLGEDLNWLGRGGEALAILKEAWSSARQLGNGQDQKWAQWDTALSYTKSLRNAKKCQDATTILQDVLKTFSVKERSHGIYSSFLRVLADCYAQMDKGNQALSAYHSAYASYDHQRSLALGDHARAKLDNTYYSLTNEYINYLIQHNQMYEALALLETNKARTLTDIQLDGNQRTVYEEWTALERSQAQERIDFYLRHSPIPNLPHMEEKQQGAYQALLRQQERQRRILKVKLQIREVAVSNQLSPEHLHAIQVDLPQDAAVVSMYVSGPQIGAFVLTSAGLAYVPTTVNWTWYRNAINQLRVALANPHNDFYVDPSKFLYKSLMKPIFKRLPENVKWLIYSPDDWLSLIPLGVLYDGKQFLIERYAISRVPSLRYFVPERHFQPVHLQAGVTCIDPALEGGRLPFLKDSQKTFQSLYQKNVTLLEGPTCSPRHLETALAAQHKPAFLHIAAHGSFYEPDPMKSGVYLSPDDPQESYGLWDARAMGSLNLESIKLVTLSSCQTGMKDPRHARDMFGIFRALFFSGAQRVLAPLWAVQDRATAQLEQEFYTQYHQHGLPALALQAAQSKLMENPKYQHPYFWAGFILAEGPA